MGRNKSLKPTLDKVIQIRVNEEFYKEFDQYCESKKENKSNTGYEILKLYLEVINNGRS